MKSVKLTIRISPYLNEHFALYCADIGAKNTSQVIRDLIVDKLADAYCLSEEEKERLAKIGNRRKEVEQSDDDVD